jgi:phosphoenolpyruvate---glycerone phosphotransferase subunit DhaL
VSTLAEAMAGVAADMTARRDELNRLDAAAGDGDLGNTVAIAAEAIRAALNASDDADPAALLRRCGSDVATAAPSTTGTLTARGLLAAARAIGTAESEPPVRLLYLGFAAALAAIQAAGKAALGDKTMIDALAPAVTALSEHADAGAQPSDALSAAAAAATLGAEQTRGMTAKAGRARWLAERSRGAEDAGARFVALVLQSAASRLHDVCGEPRPR